jgi:hypothetical protein
MRLPFTIHILLKLNGTQRGKEKFWNVKWLHINKETAHKKIISGTKITEVKNFIKILYKLKCKWGNPSGKNGARLRRGGGRQYYRQNICMKYIHMRL